MAKLEVEVMSRAESGGTLTFGFAWRVWNNAYTVLKSETTYSLDLTQDSGLDSDVNILELVINKALKWAQWVILGDQLTSNLTVGRKKRVDL